MNTTQQKRGIQLNQVTGNQDWFLVEYDDGTASLHPSWEEAMTAGNFDKTE